MVVAVVEPLRLGGFTCVLLTVVLPSIPAEPALAG
jgi:hypothetical protein